MAGAATVGLWLVNRRLGALAGLAAILMGFARIYVGAHYPQDVLAGLALGATVSGVVYLLVRPLPSWLVTIVGRSSLRLLISPTASNNSPATGSTAR